MILAVKDYVDNNGPPPPPLQNALNCRRWVTLPEGGNLRNQYAQELRQMNACLNTFDTWSAFQRAQRDGDGEFLMRNPEADLLIGRILKMDMERMNG